MEQLDLVDEVLAGRYRVNSRLGQGAMGDVFLANDTQLHRQAALKVLRQEWLSRPEVAKRLDNECRLMARMGPHTNIVTLYDRLEYKGNTVLVMEYVPGETVAKVIERTWAVNSESQAKRKTTPVLAGVSTLLLTPADAITIALQCLRGLDFAHSKGVIHRDIKPGNIIVARDHNGDLIAKIMDFGIGKMLSDPADVDPVATALTQAGGPGPGTPAYMAPEQIDPARFGQVGPATDCYAFAVTLYEMLALRLPFEGTYTELLHAHSNVEPPNPQKEIPYLSAGVSQVLLKGLRKLPAERYQSAHLFRLDLETAAQGGKLGEEFARNKHGSRTRALFAVSGVLAVAAAIAIAYSSLPFGTERTGLDNAPDLQVTPEPEPAPLPVSETPQLPEEPLDPAPLDNSEQKQAENLQGYMNKAREEALERLKGTSPADNELFTQAEDMKKQAEKKLSDADYSRAQEDFRQAAILYGQANPPPPIIPIIIEPTPAPAPEPPVLPKLDQSPQPPNVPNPPPDPEPPQPDPEPELEPEPDPEPEPVAQSQNQDDLSSTPDDSSGKEWPLVHVYHGKVP